MANTFSPFADELELETSSTEQENNLVYNNEQYAGYSPFSSTYETEATPEGELESDPAAQQYFEMLNELHDTEFESAIDNLVSELQDHLVSHEASSPFLNEAQSVQLAENYLQPILQESQQFFETMAMELEAMPLQQMTSMELETAMDNIYANRVSNFTPAQEFFFKKLVNKAKAVIKKVASVAGKISPTHILFKKLGKFIQPLLKRVLDKALNKLPISVRDIAKQLASKLFKRKNEEPVEIEGGDKNESDENVEKNDNTEENLIGSEGEMPTNYPSQNIQAEFDHYVSQLAQTDNELEQQNLLNEYEQITEMEFENQLQEIDTAREQFINELENLKEGEDPTPALENFLPVVMKAAMTVLKMGIKIIGRDKVVAFLAKLMAKWISKYIGEEKAKKLAMVVADKGLKLLKLETTENEADTKQVYEAIANTVQETITKIASFNEEVLNNPELLTHETYQAFETAAAAYFPDNTIKYEARESETGNGFWQSKGKYLKHTKTFETTLTNNQLKNIITFGGTNLLGFVSDSLQIKTNAPIKAKVFLFQAKIGTTISGITSNEKNIIGLGSASRSCYNQIHPLTKEAASIILGQPNLGKNIRPIKGRNRNLIFEGERFYYLQIAGAEMQTTPSADVTTTNNYNVDNVYVKPTDVTQTSRSTQIRRVISGSLSNGLIIKDIIYFSEADSRKILAGLKQQSVAELYEYLKKLKPDFEKNFFGDKFKTGSIILKGLLEMANKVIKENLSKTVLENIKHHIADFEKAVKDPKHGVTVIIQYKISLAKGKKIKLRLQEALSSVSINILPGFTQRSSPTISGNCPHCNGNSNNGNISQVNGKTFYAAITPMSLNTLAVNKAKYN